MKLKIMNEEHSMIIESYSTLTPEQKKKVYIKAMAKWGTDPFYADILNANSKEELAKAADAVNRVRAGGLEKFKAYLNDLIKEIETMKEDGVAPAGPVITTASLGPGALYAPKVMPMTARFADFSKDQYDQSFMKKMKNRLNESAKDKCELDEDVASGHQKNIALKTLKLSDVGAKTMGGMNHKDAIDFLLKNGYTESRLKGMLKKHGHNDEEIEGMFTEATIAEASTNFDDITPRSRVTIRDRFGKEHTGTVVMRSGDGDGWVLNMGGAHGTPGLVYKNNFVKVSGFNK